MNEIINTLIIKDIKSRFSGDTLAYIWAFINPLAWIGALIIFFSILGKQVPIYTDIISFLIPGMLSYILFRYTINSIMRTKKTSRSLLHIPSITPITVIAAAALIELLNGIIVFLILITLNFFLFDKIECHDPLVMIYGYLCAWGTGIAVGSFAAELSSLYPMVEKILPIILRPVFWISGVFYTANELPEWIAEIGSINPLFQSIEIIRDGTFLSYHSRMAIYYQPILFIALIISITFIMRMNRQKLYQSV
ncbi:Capsule polysaccharide export inner-membrane protein ctrC [Legionella beliardensis]|uniref:Transport permease protein n=1 Tax=Legionella beliardensis TaxID=91822 RepID=A0A378HYR0_9GAMM|nr:ABC transporter permease [Legionella beliardensis]STX28039.1 Capsule polysaccharide export inner-membrane protein ctrC [Legionella beliardensis]